MTRWRAAGVGRSGPQATDPDRRGWNALTLRDHRAPRSRVGLLTDLAVVAVLVLVLYRWVGIAAFLFVAGIAFVALLAFGILHVAFRVLTRTGFARRWADDEEEKVEAR